MPSGQQRLNAGATLLAGSTGDEHKLCLSHGNSFHFNRLRSPSLLTESGFQQVADGHLCTVGKLRFLVPSQDADRLSTLKQRVDYFCAHFARATNH
jgi:hypothetical protein